MTLRQPDHKHPRKEFLPGWAALLVTLTVLHTGCRKAPDQQQPMVFLLLGQSNMVGMGRSVELAASDTLMPSNVVYQEDQATLRPWDTPRLGPELTLAQQLGPAFPDRQIILAKHAIGGTSLLDWAPDWDSTRAAITGNQWTGPMYEHAMAMADSIAAREPVEFAGVFWMQGERDARIAEAGVEYNDNLRTLIEALRRDLDRPELPFIMGRVNAPADRYPALEAVREAQVRAAESIPGVQLVNTDDLSMHNDNLHYDTEGVMEMGRRFAAAYLALDR